MKTLMKQIEDIKPQLYMNASEMKSKIETLKKDLNSLKLRRSKVQADWDQEVLFAEKEELEKQMEDIKTKVSSWKTRLESEQMLSHCQDMKRRLEENFEVKTNAKRPEIKSAVDNKMKVMQVRLQAGFKEKEVAFLQEIDCLQQELWKSH